MGGTGIRRGSEDTDPARSRRSRRAHPARAQGPMFERRVRRTVALAWQTSGEGHAPGGNGRPAQHNRGTMPVVGVRTSVPWPNPPNALRRRSEMSRSRAWPIDRRYNGRASKPALPYPRSRPARTRQARCVLRRGTVRLEWSDRTVAHAYRDVHEDRLTRPAQVASTLMAPSHSRRGHGRARSCTALSGDPHSTAAGRRREER